MVFESRIAELLRNQAARFLRGFSAEQLHLGLLNGRLELHGLTLNPEPLDTLLLESEIPLVLKAGTVQCVSAQLSLLQGELELKIENLQLVFGVACHWLTREEISGHRANEIQRLEFVHTRSQSQRRNVEREMFRQVFSDYLSRLKVTVCNLHLRLEVEGELERQGESPGADAVFGLLLNSCEVLPINSSRRAASGGPSAQEEEGRELLLAERLDLRGLSLYHEDRGEAQALVPWALYSSTRAHALGALERLGPDALPRALREARRRHLAAPPGAQLLPPLGLSLRADLRSGPVCDGFHLDSCMTMEVTVKLEAPSLLNFTACTVKHLHWLLRRAHDFQLWQFLHAAREPPQTATARWAVLRDFLSLKRRVHSNAYSLQESLQMRMHCKEYVRLHKRKFNGPSSDVAWRKCMPTLTEEEARRLANIELTYPADKIVNFRLMAHSELKTEILINSSITAEEAGAPAATVGNPYRRVARELTPLEQLHLHGQHGYGVNIYRGLPPPPSSLKIRIDVQIPQGLLWVCGLGVLRASGLEEEEDWAMALDCTAQSLRLSLADSTVDTSVFATLEAPAAAPGRRPLAVLLGRSPAAFAGGSPGRAKKSSSADSIGGGRGREEWFTLLELEGTVYFCAQLKTLLTAAANSPWDILAHLSCGEVSDTSTSVGPGWSPTSGGFAAALGHTKPCAGAGAGAAATRNQSLNQAKPEKSACLRLRVPPVLMDLRSGPLRGVLVRPGQNPGAKPGSGSLLGLSGPEHSALAWFARQVSSTFTLAVFRLHLRLPPLLILSREGGPQVRLPRLEAACHLEQGGLVDGFVVGLHHLRHFIGSLASAAGTAAAAAAASAPSQERGGTAGAHRGAMNAPLSLLPLQEAPPVLSVVGSLLAALAAVLAGRSEAPAAGAPASSAALEAARVHGLCGLFRAEDETDTPASLVSLLLVILAVISGRRVLWDTCDSKPLGRQGQALQEVRAADSAMSEVYGFHGELLAVLLALGIPMHPRCMPLGAWSGALELLQAALPHAQSSGQWPSRGLVVWAARGAFANLPTRQDEVVRWLIRQRARIDEVDRAGRSLLDWACWAGAEELVARALRAGLLAPASWRVGKLTAEASPGAASPASLPSPLALAVTSRSRSVVAMLLRAACDPHAAPKASCASPLMLAVRSCEFELASLVLGDAPFLALDSALGTTPHPSSSLGLGAGTRGETPELSPSARATLVLVESLGRFSSLLSRRSCGEETAPLPLGSGAGGRPHSPGPHLDEGLFAASQLPFSDVIHPLLVRLPPPLHLGARPHHTPLSWLQRCHGDPWKPAEGFLSACLRWGLRPDATVATRALAALPPDARKVAQQLLPSGAVDLQTAPQLPATLLTDITAQSRYNKASMRAGWINGSQSPSKCCPRSPEGQALQVQSPTKGKLDPFTLHASPNIPMIWMVASTGHADAGTGTETETSSPVVLDALCVDSSHVAWNLQEMPSQEDGHPLVALRSWPLQQVHALRCFEMSGILDSGAGEVQHVVEVALKSGAGAEPVTASRARRGDDAGQATVRVLFKSSENADQFAAAVRARWQSGTPTQEQLPQHAEARAPVAVRDATVPEQSPAVATSGMANPASPDLRDGEHSSGTAFGVATKSPRPESLSDTAAAPPGLPAIRVVVAGAPRVGKSHVAASLFSTLSPGTPAPGDQSIGSNPAWLNVQHGLWPKNPRAVVHIWDCPGAPLPGLLARLLDEDAAPLLLVLVLDSELSGTDAPAELLLAECAQQAQAAAAAAAAPRQLLLVENVITPVAGAAAATAAVAATAHTSGTASPTGLPPADACPDTCRVRCDTMSPEGSRDLQLAFEAALERIAGRMQAPASTASAGQVSPAPPLSSPAGDGGDQLLSSCLRGDSMLWDPRVVTWTWSTICSAQGSLTDHRTGSCGGAVVPWDRLSRVLSSAAQVAGAANGAAEAPVLLRALADLGLLCPIPTLPRDSDETSSSLNCGWVLVPDFAKRVRLASGSSLRSSPGYAGNNPEMVRAVTSDQASGGGGGAGRGGGGPGHVRGSGPAAGPALQSGEAGQEGAVPLSARLFWEAASGRPPSLRAVLRDFLARGTAGSRKPSAGSGLLQLQIVRFVLLQSGPGTAPGLAAADDLAPGFLLIFDLISAAQMDKDKAHDISDAPEGQRSTSASRTDGEAGVAAAGPSPASPEDEVSTLVPPALRHFTTMIIGTSCGTPEERPYWDVFCSGPHAQWAWRLLLGSGAAGQGSGAPVAAAGLGAATSAAVTGVAAVWPMPRPTSVLSVAVASSPSSVLATSLGSARSSAPRPSGLEFLDTSGGVLAAAAAAAAAASAAAAAAASCCKSLCRRP